MMNVNTERARSRATRNPKILDIRIDDPVVLEELRTRDTLEARKEYGGELMELGARVARTHRPASEARQVALVFEEQARRNEERERASLDRIDDHMQTTRSKLGHLKSRMRSEMSTLVATVNRDTEAQQRAIAQLHDRTERALSGLLEGVEAGVDRAGGDSEMLVALFRERLESTLGDLRAQVSRAEQVIASGLERESALLDRRDLRAQASCRIGIDFEELMTRDLTRFGLGRGDVVERTGDTHSPGTTSKKGDIFYQLRVGDRLVPIVIECKDKKMDRMGANPFHLRDLETAMRERGGEYGIVVATLDKNIDSSGVPSFPVLQFFGDKQFVVLVDREQEPPVAFETVLHLIHRAISEQKSEGSAATINIAAIGQALQRLTDTQSRFGSLKGLCTKMADQVAFLRTQLDDLDDSLDDQTDQIKALLGLAP